MPLTTGLRKPFKTHHWRNKTSRTAKTNRTKRPAASSPTDHSEKGMKCLATTASSTKTRNAASAEAPIQGQGRPSSDQSNAALDDARTHPDRKRAGGVREARPTAQRIRKFRPRYPMAISEADAES